MKRRDLLKQIEVGAKAAGRTVEVREGGNHTVICVDQRRSAVPRHREITELTAQAIMKQLGLELDRRNR